MVVVVIQNSEHHQQMNCCKYLQLRVAKTLKKWLFFIGNSNMYYGPSALAGLHDLETMKVTYYVFLGLSSAKQWYIVLY